MNTQRIIGKRLLLFLTVFIFAAAWLFAPQDSGINIKLNTIHLSEVSTLKVVIKNEESSTAILRGVAYE